MSEPAARFHRMSVNRKLSPTRKEPYHGPARKNFPYRPVAVAPFCCSTYASIEATCPDSCAFKRRPDGKAGGCFADAGRTVHAVRRLDLAAQGRSGLDVICEEVEAIDRSWPRGVPQDGARGGRDLRLHVSGDVPGVGGAVLLGEAASRWRARGGGKVWTYTHAWPTVDRAMWGPDVSVLASIEHPEQARWAKLRGYAPAIVVPRFPNGDRAFDIGGIKAIPCPAETRGTTCVDCRLCLDQDLLALGRGIAFKVHGTHKNPALVAIGARPKQFPLAGV